VPRPCFVRLPAPAMTEPLVSAAVVPTATVVLIVNVALLVAAVPSVMAVVAVNVIGLPLNVTVAMFGLNVIGLAMVKGVLAWKTPLFSVKAPVPAAIALLLPSSNVPVFRA